MYSKILTFIAGFFLVTQLAYSQTNPSELALQQAGNEVAAYLKPLAAINVKVGIDSLLQNGDITEVHLSKLASDYPFRDNTVKDIYAIVGKYFPNVKFKVYANGSTIEELSSKFYSADMQPAKKGAKGKKNVKGGDKLVTDLSRPYEITEGLQNRHLALWQSHGFYYAQPTMRWEWQRAPLFQTVEDMYTQSYVLPFLVPMLENAGANVLLPRERDCSDIEVVVDNDQLFGGYSEIAGSLSWKNGDSQGFANPQEQYEYGQNPFRMGTYRVAQSLSQQDLKGKNAKKESVAKWIPDMPESGEYAVYVSYKTLPNSTDAAYYTVKYKGGEREFKVNQKMGGGTWIYLGTFLFDKNSDSQGVYLTNANRGLKSSKSAAVVTADGVKFGGGMGNIARKPNGAAEEFAAEVSGHARFTEGSRYWLQWAGFADTVYSSTKNMNDYTDDYTSRGRWVNTISGGSKVNPEYEGLNIPIDLSFAFHTDAGLFPDDSTVGTLMIYTKLSNGSDKYPTGESRMLGREYADILQTQIVDDVRATFEPNWSRRGLWDRSYSESRTPNVPAVLLEFLSHQNFADMKYGHDPYFKFVVSRAIYKGMLKFLSQKEGIPYVVQPLPVKDFAVELEQSQNGMNVRLSWSAVEDKLEPTAVAKRYVVYTKVGEDGFDNGTVVTEPSAVIAVEANKIYSFKVVALNEGGASFPSEILSVGVAGNYSKEKSVLVVNGFNRVAGPASFQSKDSTLAGFDIRKDFGVPYIKDIAFTGAQYEFRREMPWMDNDASGFGSCYSNYADRVVAGNTFDYPAVHGKAFMKAGYSFVSASAGAVMAGNVDLSGYPMVDFIMGKQAQTRDCNDQVRFEVFPVALQKAISAYCQAGGNVLISGADVATDLWDSYNVSEESQKFAKEVLKYRWMTDYASAEGKVQSASNPFGFKGKYSFCTGLNEKIYAVEAPDGLVPASDDAYTIFRYSDNKVSAGVAYSGVYKTVTLGFPIETLESEDQIERIVKEIVTFFEGK